MVKIKKASRFPLKDIAESNNSKVGERLITLRNLLVIKPEDISEVLSITVNTIKNAESGNKNVGIEILFELIAFYGYTATEFFNFNKSLPTWKSLRSKMIRHHQTTGLNVLTILNKQPELYDLIQFRLLDTDLFNDWKDADQVIEYCSAKYQYEYLPTSVPNTLNNAVKKGWLIRDDDSKPKRYRKRQQ